MGILAVREGYQQVLQIFQSASACDKAKLLSYTKKTIIKALHYRVDFIIDHHIYCLASFSPYASSTQTENVEPIFFYSACDTRKWGSPVGNKPSLCQLDQ